MRLTAHCEFDLMLGGYRSQVSGEALFPLVGRI
jgi:hypothetical protein